MLGQVRAALKNTYRKMRAAARRTIGYPVIYNVNKVNDEYGSKRALLIYLVKPFLIKDDDPRFLDHQNLRQCKQIADVLGEFDYIVDVADVEDKKFRPSKHYDLVISHRVDLQPDIFPNAVKVYLSTGMNHIVHNRNVRKRYQALYQRRGCRLKIRRLHTENMPFVLGANAIAGFGNELTMNTWKETFGGPTYYFNNYGFQVAQFVLGTRDYSIARKNFLFFASQDQVAKGLGLLIEVFPRCPGIDLYICSDFEYEKDFCNCYRRELWRTSNIHAIGWIRINSAEFDELIQRCAYVILPTCSDASAGSVVQCMYAGLIPIVTKEAGIDTEDFGITLADDSLEEIEKTILELADLPEEWHREHSIRTRQAAEERFSEKAFVNKWREILGDILKERPH